MDSPTWAERGCLMATTKNTITRAAAIAIAAERCADLPEVVAVLYKMYTQLTKPRAKADTPRETAAHKANVKLADAVVKAIADAATREGVQAKWIAEHVAGIDTPQKATAVAKVAIADGRLTKGKDGRATVYWLA